MRKQIEIGYSFVENVPLAYGLKQMPYIIDKIHGPLAEGQAFVTTTLNSLARNNPIRRQREAEIAKEEEEMSEQASDIETFDLNHRPRQDNDQLVDEVLWDPTPQELGSDKPIMVAEAAHNYIQQVQEQIRVGGKVPQPAAYLKNIYAESALAQMSTSQTNQALAQSLLRPHTLMITESENGLTMTDVATTIGQIAPSL